ncbi:hypothetical protein [Pseudophaeobacter sp.]
MVAPYCAGTHLGAARKYGWVNEVSSGPRLVLGCGLPESFGRANHSFRL